METEHSVFRRAGADLSADFEISLAEALCGFSRIVINHLDGRGLYLDHSRPKQRIMKPGQVIKVAGEGMPYKKSDLKGDLYLIARIKFPDDGWLQDQTTINQLQAILPKPAAPIVADTIDEVSYEEAASLEGFGADAQNGEAWEDDDEDIEVEPQCTQQ